MINSSTTAVLSVICIVLATTGTVSAQTTTPPTPQAVVAAFKRAGLEAEAPKTITARDYGAAPKLCKGVRFLIPSLGKDSGGRAFVCNSSADRDLLAGYYNALSKQGEIYFSWVFTRGPVLIQINGLLPKTKAQQFEKAIEPYGQSIDEPSAAMSPEEADKFAATQAIETAVYLKASVVLTEELATRVKAKQIGDLKLIAGILAITGIFSTTQSTLAGAPPSIEFKPAWSQGQKTARKLSTLLGDWLDKEIDSTGALRRMPAIQADADLMVKYALDNAASKLDYDRNELELEYQKRIAEMRKGFQDALK